MTQASGLGPFLPFKVGKMCLLSQNPRFPDTNTRLGPPKNRRIGQNRIDSTRVSKQPEIAADEGGTQPAPNGRLVVCGGRLMLKASREKAICMGAREVLPGAPRRSATHDHDQTVAALGAPPAAACTGDGVLGVTITHHQLRLILQCPAAGSCAQGFHKFQTAGGAPPSTMCSSASRIQSTPAGRSSTRGGTRMACLPRPHWRRDRWLGSTPGRSLALTR